jgi:hypothetical protein
MFAPADALQLTREDQRPPKQQYQTVTIGAFGAWVRTADIRETKYLVYASRPKRWMSELHR